jgi:hypothetical protein
MYKCFYVYKKDETRFSDNQVTINHVPQIGEQMIHIDDRDIEVLYKVEHVLYYRKDDMFEIYLTPVGFKDEILKDWN